MTDLMYIGLGVSLGFVLGVLWSIDKKIKKTNKELQTIREVLMLRLPKRHDHEFLTPDDEK